MTNRELLCNIGYDNLVVFDDPDYDAAIIGVSHDDRVIYDYNKMIVCFMEEEHVSAEEAAEFIDYNTIRSIPYVGAKAPIVMYNIKEK